MENRSAAQAIAATLKAAVGERQAGHFLDAYNGVAEAYPADPDRLGAAFAIWMAGVESAQEGAPHLSALHLVDFVATQSGERFTIPAAVAMTDAATAPYVSAFFAPLVGRLLTEPALAQHCGCLQLCENEAGQVAGFVTFARGGDRGEARFGNASGNYVALTSKAISGGLFAALANAVHAASLPSDVDLGPAITGYGATGPAAEAA